MSYWLDIEAAPLDVDVILGWWTSDDGVNYEWRMEIGRAGASTTKAKHWREAPTPPVSKWWHGLE